MEEEEGRGPALTGHRHPSPIADCSQTVRGQQGRMRRGAGGAKKKRMEISERRARDEEKEGREEKEKRAGREGNRQT